MNPNTLIELADKWAREASGPFYESGEDPIRAAEERGHRKAMERAADDLRTLLRVLGYAAPMVNVTPLADQHE
jgi:hypothetical protein